MATMPCSMRPPALAVGPRSNCDEADKWQKLSAVDSSTSLTLQSPPVLSRRGFSFAQLATAAGRIPVTDLR